MVTWRALLTNPLCVWEATAADHVYIRPFFFPLHTLCLCCSLAAPRWTRQQQWKSLSTTHTAQKSPQRRSTHIYYTYTNAAAITPLKIGEQLQVSGPQLRPNSNSHTAKTQAIRENPIVPTPPHTRLHMPDGTGHRHSVMDKPNSSLTLRTLDLLAPLSNTAYCLGASSSHNKYNEKKLPQVHSVSYTRRLSEEGPNFDDHRKVPPRDAHRPKRSGTIIAYAI